MTSRAQTGGGAVVDALVAAGVRHAFTVPGESFLGILDALHDAPIRTIAARHEAGAGFMAEAVGQLTGRPAACLVTRAVGAANLSIALHTARQDSTPLIAIVGQVERAFRGREAFQEVDQVATFGALCKAAVEVADAPRLGAETARLIALARAGRPGPVLLSIPEDAANEPIAAGADPLPAGSAAAAPTEPERPRPEGDAVRAVLDLLAAAAAPIVVAGAGVLRSGAAGALRAFTEASRVPVIASWRRPDVLANDHPLYLGMSGMASPAAVRERLRAADVLVALGTRLNEPTSLDYTVPAATVRLVHIDLAPGFAGDRRQPDLALRADAGAFLADALALLAAGHGGPVDPAAREARNRADRARYEAATTRPAAAADDDGGGVDPAAVVRALAARLPGDAIVTTDAGNFGGWAARYLPFRARMRFLGPTSGAMGYALPAAIGAAVAAPERPVVALAGDGGLAMLMAELETAVRERLRLTVIVHDNRRYGTIVMHQLRDHPGRQIATEIGPLDFAAVAQACGARALRVARDDEVDGALAEALDDDGVTLLHVATDRRRLSVDRTLER